MSRPNFIGIVALSLGAVLTGCRQEDPNDLSGSRLVGGDPNGTAAGVNNTFNHAHESIGGANGITDVVVRRQEEIAIGPPEEVARLHGAQKVSYASLGTILSDLGVNLGNTAAKNNTPTAGGLYASGKAALGAPVFSSRTPEMTSPSTSALAKEYDIFVAGSSDIIANIGNSKRCPGVTLVQNGQLTADGISCLIGKPATADHVSLANKLVTDSGDPTKGTAIAVATILAAAHISE
jgi:hypothetical protein